MLDLFAKRAASTKDDVLSGLTVALALVPEAIAFAFVAGVSPHIGLYSAIFIGLITAVCGGRPGMISGATGAMAVVIVGLVAIHGIGYLIPAVILCGIIQICVGLLRLGKLIRLVPHSVMLGFVNGLAIVIFMAQIDSFKIIGPDGTMGAITGTPMVLMVILILLTMGIITFLPKLTKAVPSSLAAILIVTGLSWGLNQYSGENIHIKGTNTTVITVKDMLLSNLKAKAVTDAQKAKTSETITAIEEKAAELGLHVAANGHGGALSVMPAALRLKQVEVETAMASVVDVPKGRFPKLAFLQEELQLAPFNLHTLGIILPFALILAGVGLIESLMTLTLIDEITETRGRGNRECIGQGLANVVCGMFGGMGGCAMIGQSLINVNSGGRGRLSGIAAALALLLFVMVLSPFIMNIPMAALVGVMFMVVIGTFEWSTLHTWRKIPPSDVIIMIFVAGYTVLFHNLAMAVLIGVIMQALVFAWQHATHLFADESTNEMGSRIYQLHGPLFFASVSSFNRLFKVEEDPDDVVIDFYYTRVYDQSGLEAIGKLAERYTRVGKRLHLRHLSEECMTLLDKAGNLIEVNVSEDPHYHVATDRLA
jgi:sulfate permease, SulP family